MDEATGPRIAPRREPLAHRLTRLASGLFAGVLPTLLLCVGVARFILNHFFAHAPYLLDAGWYSDIVYRAGLFPRNPQIACAYADYYFGVHFSPLISVASLLSYLVPLPRIEWYALFQAFMFLPFGIATYLLAARLPPDAAPAGALRRLPVTVLAAFAFTFSGQVLTMIPYPHYEVAIAGFICLLLVALATGRERQGWVFLALALAVREDAGFHATFALAPLLYLRWRGLAVLASRRTLLAMCAVAVVSSIIGIVCQKLVFDGAAVMSAVYLGKPIYSHITAAVLADRARDFLGACQLMYYPFLATCLLAAVRRDPNYLLGWAVNLPWFGLNFLASQPQKATFEAYAGFPFVVSSFWVYVYGAMLAPPARRMRPIAIEAVFAGICILSTVGYYREFPKQARFTVHEMTHTQPMDRAATHAFVEALGKHRDQLGRLYADYSAAAIALESVVPENRWGPGTAPADAITFHEESVFRDQLLPDLFANELDVCTRIVAARIFLCTRERLPADLFAGLATDVVPSSFTFANSLKRRGVGVSPRGITLQGGVGIDGWLGQLPRGTYELTWTLATDVPAPADGAELVTVQIMSGADARAAVTAPNGARALAVRFDASGEEVLWFRSHSAFPSTLIVTQAQVRRVP